MKFLFYVNRVRTKSIHATFKNGLLFHRPLHLQYLEDSRFETPFDSCFETLEEKNRGCVISHNRNCNGGNLNHNRYNSNLAAILTVVIPVPK